MFFNRGVRAKQKIFVCYDYISVTQTRQRKQKLLFNRHVVQNNRHYRRIEKLYKLLTILF